MLADAQPTGQFQQGNTQLPIQKHQAPKIAYLLLAASVLAISSAAAVFRRLDDAGVPPITVSAWRMQATTLVLAPAAIWQWRTAIPEIRQKAMKSWWVIAASGCCLALHFGSWVWGLDHTSLPHGLLFVTSAPLLMTLGSVLLRLPVSRGEVIGALGGFLGMLLLCIDAASNRKVTFVGDAMSLLGAVAIIGYLHAGSAMRSWMPIFIYATPVTAVAALVLTPVAIVAERAELFAAGSGGAFGYFASKHWLPVLYLALGPGVVGHTGFNTLLRFFSPLVISLAFPLEPLIGSFIAWAVGETAVPGVLTWLGGTVMIAALMYSTYSESTRVTVKRRRPVINVAQLAAEARRAQEAEDMAPFTLGDDDDFYVNES